MKTARLIFILGLGLFSGAVQAQLAIDWFTIDMLDQTTGLVSPPTPKFTP